MQSNHGRKTVNSISQVIVAAVLAAAAFQAVATNAKQSSPRVGAVLTPVDRYGRQVGPSIPLPDCRSCTVKQTGPNSYTVKIPPEVRQKLGMPVKPQ